MSGIDLFGRKTRPVPAVNNTSTPIKIKSNGGLELNSNNSALSIKLDSNTKNILSLSIWGLMAKIDALTENWRMGGFKITDLDMTYPPINSSQATSWGQVNQCVAEQNLLNWGIHGNNASQNATLIFGTTSDSDIMFIRNEQKYILFKQNEIMFSNPINIGAEGN